LRARGHRVLLVQPRPGTPSTRRVRTYDDFEIVEIGAAAPAVPYLRNYFKNERLTSRLAPVLARLAADERVDLLHAQHVLTTPAAVEAARAVRLPVVCTIRDYWPVCYWSDLIVSPTHPTLCPGCSAAGMTRCTRSRAGRAWPFALAMIPYMQRNLARKREAVAGADAVVAVSSTIAADLRARVPELDPARLTTIPNPVDLAVLDEAARHPPRLAPPYAVYAGKLAPNKGAAAMVDVVREAKLAWPLVVVGDGPDRARIESQVAGAGLDVRVLGWRPRDETLQWIAHADILLFPSRGPESLSRVLLEAAGLGRAMAAMDTGGTRDIVRHEETGLLSASSEGLAADVARLAREPALRARLGAAARRHVEASFASRRVLDRIEALYQELIARRSRAHG
jgi:glycosyltransferase involved in cell wall biosynthesis